MFVQFSAVFPRQHQGRKKIFKIKFLGNSCRFNLLLLSRRSLVVVLFTRKKPLKLLHCFPLFKVMECDTVSSLYDFFLYSEKFLEEIAQFPTGLLCKFNCQFFVFSFRRNNCASSQLACWTNGRISANNGYGGIVLTCPRNVTRKRPKSCRVTNGAARVFD